MPAPVSPREALLLCSVYIPPAGSILFLEPSLHTGPCQKINRFFPAKYQLFSGNNSCNNLVFPIPTSWNFRRMLFPDHMYCWPSRQRSLVPSTSSSHAMPRSWVLLADQTGLSAQLSNFLTTALQSKGDIVVQACPGSAADISALLLETTASYGQLNGILYLAGLCPQQGQCRCRYYCRSTDKPMHCCGQHHPGVRNISNEDHMLVDHNEWCK